MNEREDGNGTTAESVALELGELQQKIRSLDRQSELEVDTDALDSAGPLMPVRAVSGTYTWRSPLGGAETGAGEAGGPSTLAAAVVREDLRLDVDGRYPQSTVSGRVVRSAISRTDWIASLTLVSPNRWKGGIWYKEGDRAAFPYTKVQVTVNRLLPFLPPRATVTFSGDGVLPLVRVYQYSSETFRPVELEFDCAQGVTAALQIATHAHPNRPASLPSEVLTIDKVFRRTGFNVTRTSGDNLVPLAGAGPNATWSDMEMHDAMQAYWSRFADKPQWSLWTFFAARHDMGPSLGGIMFDDIGPNHRQGTAIFVNSFISQAPAGDPAPAAWVARMRFWTAVHEMGHAFNLAHSWQKALGTPWIPLPNEPLARSFMNYPYSVPGGQAAFFADFDFRFSDAELLFMRHAPLEFVQMGNADWFDHHGFQQDPELIEADLKLELRVNRDRPVFEFLEPVVVELKLRNVSEEPVLVDEDCLDHPEHMVVIVKKDNQPARQLLPFARYCTRPRRAVVEPGQARYGSLFASVGRTGWLISEPGDYTVQLAIEHEGKQVVSNGLRIRVLPPRGYEEEVLAQDFFSEQVGRVLNFDGSQFLIKGNGALREVAEKLGDRPAARHAQIALAMPLARPYKLIDFELPGKNGADSRGEVQVRPADHDAAADLSQALASDSPAAARTLGHIDYKYYVDQFTAWLAAEGDRKEAARLQQELLETLTASGVKQSVLEEIEARLETLSEPRPEERRRKREPRE